MEHHKWFEQFPAWRSRLQQSRWWYALALCVLCPLQWLCVSRSPWFAEPPKPIGDGPDYENIAYHLWQGRGFVFDSTNAGWRPVYEQSRHDYSVHLNSAPRNLPTTGRPPLFPLVVAGIYGLWGRNAWSFAAVRLFSATCLAVAGALAVGLTAELLVGQGNARLANRKLMLLIAGATSTLVFVAVNRTLRDYATDFLTEPLALLLLQIFVLLAVKICCGKATLPNTRLPIGPVSPTGPARIAWGWGLSAGAVLGALILTRSMFVVWLPAIWLLFVIAWPAPSGLRLKLATLVVLAAGLVCAPWWVRNCVVLQRPMPLGTQGAITLLGGYSDAAMLGNGDWQASPEQELRQVLSLRPDFQVLPSDSAREVLVAQEASRRVRKWFWGHLSDLPVLVAKRIYVHWNPYAGASLLWKVPLIIGVIGLIVVRGRVAYWLLGLPVTSTLVVAAFYSTGGRFLVPLYGILFTVAGLGVAYATRLLFGGAIDEGG